MPQVDSHHPPREFKFVGGPSRKRRRNAPRLGSVIDMGQRKRGSAPAGHQTKRTCPEALPVDPGARLPSPTMSTFDIGGFVMPPAETQDAQDPQPQPQPQPLLETAPFIETGWTAEEYMDPFQVCGLDPLLYSSALPADVAAPPLIPINTAPSPTTSNTSSSTDSASNCQQSQTSPESLAGSESPDSSDSCGPYSANNMHLESLQTASHPHLYIQPSALYDTLTRMFARYDQEFCLLPLTYDSRTNPFRFSFSAVQSFRLLRHCVLALSYRHVSHETGGSCAREAALYRRRSLQLLHGQNAAGGGSDASLLDAVCILFTLDCAASGLGPWPFYISHAERLLHHTPITSLSSQHRSQLMMFVWYDVLLAVTNRSSLRLSSSTVRSILDDADSAGNEFFTLTGCPLDILRFMARLAVYAHEHRLAAGMSCVHFDTAPVRRLQRRLTSWASPEFADPHVPEDLWAPSDTSTDDNIEDRLDRYHCAESWRNALLLYIGRVFATQKSFRREESDEEDERDNPQEIKDTPSSPILEHLARRTLNHVKSCRSTNFVQKQLLLPVFLSGCETSDAGLRADARNFCSWWCGRTRYQMFLTARAVLEDVWQQGVWWGDVIDQRARSGKEYLLG